MPAFVGPVQIDEIFRNGVFTVGDAFILSPKGSSKASLGSGVANTGDFTEMHNLFSITNFDDVDLIDQVNISNK
jgi:hypothetical protein